MQTNLLKIGKTITAIAITAALFTSCKKELINTPADTLTAEESKASSARIGDLAAYTLDVDKFATGIENALSGKLSGYGYAIFNNGAVYYKGDGGAGWNRRPVDAPQRPHGAQQRQGLASSTKYAVAVLVARILEKNGKTMDEKIYKYLPSNWTPDVNFKTVTFGELLAHKAGLIKYGNQYADIRKTVEDGINNIQHTTQTRVYDNINYFLPHYLVPYMIGKLENPTLLSQLKLLENSPEALNNLIATTFRNYLRSYVFKPAGLQYWDRVDFAPWDNNGAVANEAGCRYYTTLNSSEQGSLPRSMLLESGPGGLYISPVEYGRMISATASGKIISASLYAQMKTELIGFDWAINGARGTYYAKNGKARAQEMLIDFGKTQVIIIANCDFGGLSSNPGWITNAYDNATK